MRETGRDRERQRQGETDRDRQTDRQTDRDRGGYGRFYSFRPSPIMKGCRWMTYRLKVHAMIVPMNKKTNKLTTMCLTRY